MNKKQKNNTAVKTVALEAGNITTHGLSADGLPKNPLEVLETLKDFPTTDKVATGEYYNWHYDPDLLTLLLRHQTHHESAVRCKTDTAALSYRPHITNSCFDAWLTWKVVNNAIQALLKEAREKPEETMEIVGKIRELQESLEADKEKLDQVQDFYRFLPPDVVIAGIYDYNYLGNIFLRLYYDNTGDISHIRHLFSRSMRVGVKGNYYLVMKNEIKKQFSTKKILHIKMYGPESSIYGTPSYLGSQNSNLLSNAYELLFLKFIENGAHLGHIFLCNFNYDDRNPETGISEREEKVKADITAAKGIGAGKNWYFNLGGITDGEDKPAKLEDVVKIIPLGELLSNMNMDVKASETLRNNILSAHRVPPQIMAVYVEAKAAGDLDKIVDLYNKNTTQPIQRQFRDAVNDRLPPERWIDFDPYMIGG